MGGIAQVQRALSAEMAANGWTRAQLARKIGIDPGTLGDLLDGRRRPKAPTQGRIEAHFGWPPGTVAEVLAGRADLPVDDEGRGGDPDVLTLELPLEGLDDVAREEVAAAARLRALEKIRELRAAEPAKQPDLVFRDKTGETVLVGQLKRQWSEPANVVELARTVHDALGWDLAAGGVEVSFEGPDPSPGGPAASPRPSPARGVRSGS